MTTTTSTSTLFISYASRDRHRVEPIVAELEQAGVAAWIDIAGIAGGESYGTAIVEAIRDCDALLLLCSAASLASRNVRQEIALAWRFSRPILPLRLEPVEIPDALAYWLEAAQWVDMLERPAQEWLPDVLRGIVHLSAPPAGDRSAPRDLQSDAPTAALPEAPTLLLGRDREVAELSRRLTTGARLLTLTGPGGVGKTRLAVEVARSVAASFPDGVVFVDLAPVTDPGLVLAAIAGALGVREAPDRSVEEEVTAFLRTRQLLLVLDNVEQVVTAAPAIADLVASAPGVAVVATSRVPLAVRAEQEVPVGTLPFPAGGAPPDAVAASPAVTLFLERVRATGVELTVTEHNAATLTALVRRLDGLPLAIELAAARVRLFPPDALLSRLEHRLPLLTGGARDLPERQQTLAHTIGWSYDLLAPPEQTLFRRLAVFVGGASFDAVEQIAVVDHDIDPYQGLAELLRHNLLRQERTEGEPRFSMLETIREYADDQLVTSGEADPVRERHADYFLALSGGATPPRRGSDQFGPWLAAVEMEHDNLRAALAWAVDRPEDGTALQIACNLGQFWFVRGHFSEGRRWLGQVLAKSGQAAPALVARAHTAAAMLARVQGDNRAALGHAEHAVVVARQGEDGEVLARALYALGVAYQVLVQTDQAAEALGEALVLARGINGLEAQVGSILNVLGDVTFAQGDPARAVQLVEEGLALKRAVGDEFGAAVCLNMLGVMALSLEDLPRAADLFAEALALHQKTGDREGVANALLNLGNVAGEQGDVVRAVGLVREALELFLDLGDRAGVAIALEGFATHAERRGAATLATAWFSASAALREAIGEPVAVEQRASSQEFEMKLRDQLGPEAFATQWAVGQTRPEAAVIADAMAWASDPAHRHEMASE